MAVASTYTPRKPSFIERVPAAEEAERALIAASIVSPSNALACLLDVPEHAFTEPRFRTVRQAIGRLNAQGKGIDLVTLYEQMNADGFIGRDGVFDTYADFSALLNDAPTLNVEAYAEAIMSANSRRVQLRHATRISLAASRGDPEEMVKQVEIAQSELARLTGQDHTKASAEDGIWRPQTQELAALMVQDLPPVRWFVKDIFAEGVTLFAAKAKRGKTTFLFHACASLASGSPALGELETQPCEVLYLALEDNPRRIQRRTRQMLQGEQPPPGFHLVYQWPQLDQGGLDALRTYLHEHPAVGFVVVDTLEHIRPRRQNGGGYADDYASIRGLQRLAADLQVGIVVLVHLRKHPAEDPFDEINATMGLLASVDNAMVMRSGHDDIIELHRRGREYDDDSTLALKGDRGTLGWHILGKLDELARSAERDEILQLLRAEGRAMTPTEIAKALGKNRITVQRLLRKMLDEPIPAIRSQGGVYSVIAE